MRKKIIITLFAVLLVVPIFLITICFLIINPYKKYVTSPDKAPQTHVGIVLGAGVNKQGKPFKELQARLDSAAKALNAGIVDKLILSGDNRFKGYNEPAAMQKYLIDVKGISVSKLQPDYAGRSTYESCERAAKIFNIKQTILFSAGSHLPRAIYLCRHFGIETYGIANDTEANNSTRRELMARVKAVYNITLVGEPTVLGKSIKIN